MIPTKEVDYLEQDEPIRNQNFVCLSFLSPEELIKKKEAFFFEKYTVAYVKKNLEFIETLETLFPDKKDEIRILKDNFDFLFNESKINESYNYFVQDKSDSLEKEFYEQNDFKTSIRGIKVRGVYDTIQEAQSRSEKLRKLDCNKFSIFIAQVGCWCPWSPNPEHIEDQEFAETELNTIMHKYKENQEDKQQHFAERKNFLKSQISETEEIKKQNVMKEKLENIEEGTSTIEISDDSDDITLNVVNDKDILNNMHDEDDPWIKAKEKNV